MAPPTIAAPAPPSAIDAGADWRQQPAMSDAYESTRSPDDPAAARPRQARRLRAILGSFPTRSRWMRRRKRCRPAASSRYRPPTARRLGIATFNPHTLIAARILAPRLRRRASIGTFFAARLERALTLAPPALSRALLSADPCRGRRLARHRARPFRRRAELPDQHRRHGAARGRVPRRLPRGAGAARHRACATTPPRAPSKASPARIASAFGELRAPVEIIENGARFVDRSARRAEDRLVLRPAREPPPRQPLCRGCARPRSLLLRRRLRHSRRARRRRSGARRRPLETALQLAARSAELQRRRRDAAASPRAMRSRSSSGCTAKASASIS